MIGCMVSVLMLVYNHECYLKKAIDSILSQEYTGKIEIIIGEDCSTDNSREIVKKFEREYPDIIKPIYHSTNVGMIENLKSVVKRAQGKYVAFLEGDDYWIDKGKLKTQVEFLEQHKEYSGVTHNVMVVDENGDESICNQNIYAEHREGDYNLNEFLLGIQPGQTASFVFRNFFIGMENEDRERIFDYKMNGDTIFLLLMLFNGKVYCMGKKMSAYRYVLSGGSSWNAVASKKNLSEYYFNSALEIERFAFAEYGVYIKATKKRFDSVCGALLFLLRNRQLNDLKIFISIWKKEKSKILFIKYILSKIFRLKGAN